LRLNKSGTQFTLGTTNTELAKQYGFERTDKYYYEKEVKEEEFEVLEYVKKL
jgi:hypothetical protein